MYDWNKLTEADRLATEKAMEAAPDGQEPIALVVSGGDGEMCVRFNGQNFAGLFSITGAEIKAVRLAEMWRDKNNAETVGSPVPLVWVGHHARSGNRTTYTVFLEGKTIAADDEHSAVTLARRALADASAMPAVTNPARP